MSNKEDGYKTFLKISALSLMVYLMCHALIKPGKYKYDERSRDFVRINYAY